MTDETTGGSDDTTTPDPDPTPTPTPPLLIIDESQPLIIHARKEISKANIDSTTGDAYLQAIQGFLNLGLKNETAIPQITALLNQTNIAPLTTSQSEWTQISDNLWASTRNIKAFSQDGGKTYFIMDGLTRQTAVTDATIA